MISCSSKRGFLNMWVSLFGTRHLELIRGVGAFKDLIGIPLSSSHIRKPKQQHFFLWNYCLGRLPV